MLLSTMRGAALNKANPNRLMESRLGAFSRRQVLTSAMALGANCLLGSSRASFAGDKAPVTRIIDVHHHFFPHPCFRKPARNS